MRSIKGGFGAAVMRLAGLGLALSLGPGLAWSPVPAQAASAIIVDDDAVQCPNRTHTTLADAFAAAPVNNANMTVCAGNYATPPLTISGKTNFKLTAKGIVTISPSGMPFTAHLLSITNSSKVAVQGFTFDGLGQVGTNAIYAAIYLSESSGTISKNTIVNWYGLGYPAARHAFGIWIYNTAGQLVTVDRNILSNMDYHAIHMQGLQKVKITGNTITTDITSAGAAGIVATTGPTGTIAKNIITSNALPGTGKSFSGLVVYSVSNMKITGNKITGASTGISLGGPLVNKNTVSGNMLNETMFGIDLTVSSPAGPAEGNNNHITGNKIVNTSVQGTLGINVTATGDMMLMFDAYALNEVVKGNTITKFAAGVQSNPGYLGVVTGVFAPNKWVP